MTSRFKTDSTRSYGYRGYRDRVSYYDAERQLALEQADWIDETRDPRLAPDTPLWRIPAA